MVRRLLLFLPLIGLIACGNPSGFRTKSLQFQSVQTAPPSDTAKRLEKAKSGDVVRETGRIQFDKLNAVWDGEKVTLKGSLKMAGQAYGEVELTGVRQGDQIKFTTEQEDLKKRIRAQATCYSEDQACNDFFIDFFMKDEKGVIEHDQFVVIKPTHDEPQSSTTTSTTIKSSTPVIEDEVPESGGGSFVGISDEEARDLFGDDLSVTTSTTTTTVTVTTLKGQLPAKTPTTTSSTTTTTVQRPVVLKPLQAFGNPSGESQKNGKVLYGRLENATDLTKLASQDNSFFRLIWPDRNTAFATRDMASIIQKLSQFIHQRISGYIMAIGDVSALHGGKLFSHASHQNGLDADIAYIVNNKRSEFSSVLSKQSVNSDFLAEDNWALIKEAFSIGRVELVFVVEGTKKAFCQEAIRSKDLKDADDRGPAFEILRRMKLAAGHDNHFHLRISCPKTDKSCWQPTYTLGDSGCF